MAKKKSLRRGRHSWRKSIALQRRKSFSFRRRLSGFETLEPRQMLDASGFAGNDHPPDLNLDAVQAQTIVAGQALSFNIFTAGATLVDTDQAGNATGDTLRVVLDPDVGTDTPVGATITEAGDFSWTPTPGQIGEQTIIVIAIDGGAPALADAETFVVNVIEGSNQAPGIDLNGPDAGNDSSATFTEDGGPVAIVGANLTVTDSDGSNLTSATASITNLLNGTEESLSVVTTGTTISATYDDATGVLSLAGSDTVANYQQVLRTLTYNNASQDPDITTRSIDITVNDGTDDSVTRTSSVAIVAQNDSPDLAVIANQNTAVGQEMVVNVSATDVDSGDTLTFLLDPNDSPSAASIEQTSNTTATIRWTPQAGDLPGPTNFTVLVTDDGNLPLADSQSFSVSLESANSAPDLAVIPDQSATVGEELVVNVTATDADTNDSLTFSLDFDSGATPAGATIEQTSNTTATIRWTPDVSDVDNPVPFRVLITDDGTPVAGDAESFTATVTAVDNTSLLARGRPLVLRGRNP